MKDNFPVADTSTDQPFVQSYSESAYMTFEDFGDAWNWLCKKLDVAKDNKMVVMNISITNNPYEKFWGAIIDVQQSDK